MLLSAYVIVLVRSGYHSEYTIAPFYNVNDRKCFAVEIDKVCTRHYEQLYGYAPESASDPLFNMLKKEAYVEICDPSIAPEALREELETLPAYRIS